MEINVLKIQCLIEQLSLWELKEERGYWLRLKPGIAAFHTANNTTTPTHLLRNINEKALHKLWNMSTN